MARPPAHATTVGPPTPPAAACVSSIGGCVAYAVASAKGSFEASESRDERPGEIGGGSGGSDACAVQKADAWRG